MTGGVVSPTYRPHLAKIVTPPIHMAGQVKRPTVSMTSSMLKTLEWPMESSSYLRSRVLQLENSYQVVQAAGEEEVGLHQVVDWV